MKTKIYSSTSALIMGLMFLANTAFALNACIFDSFGDQYSISVANYYGPGNIKSVTGSVYFGAQLFLITGTCDKSAKILYLTSTNTNQGNGYCDFVYDEMHYTNGFYKISDDWFDCNMSGNSSCTGTLGMCEVGSQKASSSGNQVKGMLHQNTMAKAIEVFPNPVTNHTSVSYTVTGQDEVSISIYNHLGQLVKVIANEATSAGTYTVDWDVTDSRNVVMPDGIYFVRMSSKSGSQTIPVIVQR